MIIYYKHGGKTFRLNPDIEPVAIVLSPKDKENISSMSEDATVYCAYPKRYRPVNIRKWIKRIKDMEKERSELCASASSQ